MSIPAFSAAQAYANAVRAASDSIKTVSPNPSGTADFGKLVGEAVEAAVNSGNATEKIAAQHVAGKASLVDVVTAVAETELTMRTLVTVRDRVIAAYQDVLRMPI